MAKTEGVGSAGAQTPEKGAKPIPIIGPCGGHEVGDLAFSKPLECDEEDVHRYILRNVQMACAPNWLGVRFGDSRADICSNVLYHLESLSSDSERFAL